ncbi:hypothetical protein SAMN02745216_02710 [Desulfatibacillum alkenivorans DSM 16219]|jgi:hypothetical protein|uniref:DUF8058 domain-containing protein n=1 Tax=Desulfatibacillum alkenivorans DSM 16219 TaxID=1121393 RepID=A0A1M6NZ84_9BACT|nr:hypothetical protein [Desulfatibacillum alkenivorans]SHK01003.1 hypothetical protein SAMN02745216_02710 [Desulfatibacillum alkenivorans DSM 16219]
MEKPKALAVLQIITGAGIICFWIAFFTVGLAPENPPDGYFAFEHSFPLPDGVLCVGLIVSGALLLKGSPKGRTLGLISAGGLLFLGLLDFSFNIQNGMYAMGPGESLPNMFINAWCVGLGAAMAFKLRLRA